MKKKKSKKNFKNDLYKNAVKIKCQYCSDKETCNKRGRKERDEKLGIMTYCLITSSKPKSYAKKNKINILQG